MGFAVDSVSDLVNTEKPYPEALPLLVEHLRRPYPDRNREWIARALAVPDAKFAWEPLLTMYRQEPAGTDAKDGLAVALSAMADRDDIEELIALTQEPRHGESRILFLASLKRSRDQKARQALEQAVRDPDLEKEARHLLSRKQ